MCDTEARAVRQLLGGFDGQVGTNGPVTAQDQRHNDQNRRIVGQEGTGEQDQPERGGRLLHLHMAGGKQGAQLGVLAETHQQDVHDECD